MVIFLCHFHSGCVSMLSLGSSLHINNFSSSFSFTKPCQYWLVNCFSCPQSLKWMWFKVVIYHSDSSNCSSWLRQHSTGVIQLCSAHFGNGSLALWQGGKVSRSLFSQCHVYSTTHALLLLISPLSLCCRHLARCFLTLVSSLRLISPCNVGLIGSTGDLIHYIGSLWH